MLKRIFCSNKVTALDMFAALILLLSLLIRFITGVGFNDLLQKEAVVDIGYLANGTDAGNFYYIDSGKGRVTGIRNNGVEFILTSGSDISDFYQAEDLCIDPRDNSFYVATVDWDSSGFLLGSERILHYSASGRYIKTVYEVLYQPTDEINKHRIFDIRFMDGKLSFVRADDKQVSFCVIENGEIISEQSYDYPEAWVYFQNFAHEADGTIYGIEKRGHIIKFADTKQSVVYTSPKNSKEVIYDIDIQNGKLFFVDIYGGRICRVLSDRIAHTILSSQILNGKSTNGKGVFISNVYAKHDTLFTVYNDTVINFQADGRILSREKSFLIGQRQTLIRFSYIFIFGLSFLCLVYLVLRIVFHVLVNKPKISMVAVSETAIVIFTLILSSSIIFGVSNPFQYNYLKHVTRQLRDIAISGANLFNENWFNNINSASDFMNEDYAAMSNLLHSITTDQHTYDSRYGAEVNVIDDDGRGYAIVYTDNSIGNYYPMAPATYADVKKVYDTGEPVESAPTLAGGGTFLFGHAPIFNREGKVVAVFSITQDNYRIMETFDNIIINIAISVMLIIIALIFFMNEGFVIIPQISEEKRLGTKYASIGDNPAPLSMLRIMSFAVGFTLNMTASFLSVYTSSFWNESLGISEAMAGAFPLFMNVIFVSITALFCGVLFRKIGFRYLTAIGVVSASCGDLLAGLSQNYISICFALLLNGLGFGILFNSISLAIGMVEPPEKQAKGFVDSNIGNMAGINIGSIIGSILASNFSYNKVFFVSSTLWASLIFIFWRVGRKIEIPVKVETITEKTVNNKPKFIPIKAFILAVIVCMPYAFMDNFEYYYIPIFIDSLGYNPTYASMLFMIHSVCVVALSSSLAGIMWDKLKEKSIVISYFLALSSWILIVNTTDLKIASMAMVLLGISFSFGTASSMQSILNAACIKNVNEDTRLSLVNFSIGMGTALAPIVIGTIVDYGATFGMFAFAGICAVLLTLSFIIMRTSE